MFTTLFFQPFFSLGIEKNSDFAKKLISKNINKIKSFKIDCIYDYNNEIIYCSRIYNSTKNKELKKLKEIKLKNISEKKSVKNA